jgi:thiamine-monophosphate kinase
LALKRRLGEFEIIERFFAPLARGEGGALGLVDDAAILPPMGRGRHMVVTTDAIVAGVHFLADDPAEVVALKALAVNLSDLAAMGADPRAYLLVAALPKTLPTAWIGRFARGLARGQRRFGIHLIGGDTVATPGPLTLNICAIGSVSRGAELRRSAAIVGDAVYVSGTVGDAALGLRALRGELAGLGARQRAVLVRRYREPDPRIELGRALGRMKRTERVHAAIDVSDGLVADVTHICEASGVGATIEAERLPLSDAVRVALGRDAALLKTIVSGGDDYELAFTAPPLSARSLARLSGRSGVPVTAIGTIVSDRRVRVLSGDGRELEIRNGGYRHF